MTIAVDSHKLTLPALVDLYQVDLNPIGIGQVYYFYPGTDANSQPVAYLGNTYAPWPVTVSGLTKTGNGASPRPTAEIGNAGGAITQMCRTYQDLVGATVLRRRTLATYLAANVAEYVDELYVIERRAEETFDTVKFELASPLDFLDKQLPGVLAIATGCVHRYASTENGSGCSWVRPGTDIGKWFSRIGIQVHIINEDVCGKRLSDCKLRFGANNPLDYGGNPGLGRSS